MIRRPSYTSFLANSTSSLANNTTSSVTLSPNRPNPMRPLSHNLTSNSIPSQMQYDQTSVLDLIQRIPNDPHIVRHSCAIHPSNKSNLNSSFANAHRTISPKKAGQQIQQKPSRPLSSIRSSARQQLKSTLFFFPSRLELAYCLALKPETSFLSSQEQSNMICESKSNTHLLRLGQSHIQKEIGWLKELKIRRIQNNVDIMDRLSGKLKSEIEVGIPKSALSNKENKDHQSSKLNICFPAKERSITPVKTISVQPDPSIFKPIQFRKRSSNQGLLQNKIFLQKSSKSPFKMESLLNSVILKPQSSIFSTDTWKQKKERKMGLSDFALGKKLGQGRFGSVCVAVHKLTGSIFALKKVGKSTIRQNFLIEQFILQVKIQLYIENSQIVRLFGIFDDEDSIYLLLEYLEGGTIYSQLKRKSKGKMTEEETGVRMGMICEAVHCLHQKGIAHRDIKPQNIIITNDICKLADFGWATICDERRKTYCGTTDYVAPQIVEGLEYDISVDLWCVGVLTYELLAGRAPFYHISRQETFNKIKNVDSASLSYPEYFSQDAIDFIGRLIKKNPNERMEMVKAVNHPFITKYQL